MKYDLNNKAEQGKKRPMLQSLRELLKFMADEQSKLYFALAMLLCNAAIASAGPYLIGYAIDHYIRAGQWAGVLTIAGVLLVLYAIVFVTGYFQTRLMGGIGQRMVFALRNVVFMKLQQVPVAFFNQNKAGDLISRVNSDTERLNQFFSQSLLQFVNIIFSMLVACAFLLAINFRLGMATVLPAVFMLAFIVAVSPWIKRKNAANLKNTGLLSAEIQERIQHFKVIIAFNRRDYFRQRFDVVNQQNYQTAVSAGIANTLFVPLFAFFSNAAQLIVLAYGIYLINAGAFTVGLLVSYMAYSLSFYNPIRQLAALWTSFQTALSSWDRIQHLLAMHNDMDILPKPTPQANAPLMEFRHVDFGYTAEKHILRDVNFSLEAGKTYAFVGPTGGGKTTTASLMSRLYDPTQGTIFLDGADIRSYTDQERTAKIGFILQEPFLFGGTLRQNILYGNNRFDAYTDETLMQLLEKDELSNLLTFFEDGLNTNITATGSNLSLGQKQLLAFMQAYLRKPELLILDEATANVDTLTEQLLEQVLAKIKQQTTLVIIAHRLNTIQNADQIFFVNAGEVIAAGSFADAVAKLMSGKRKS